MNNKNIQTIAMEEIWKSQSDGYLPVLLEIYNPDIVWNDESLKQENGYLRLISDSNGCVYKGNYYLPSVFEFSMPEEDGKKIGNSTLTVSAIDSRVIKLLRSIEIMCEIIIIATFVKNDSIIKFYPLDSLKATVPTASYNKSTVTFNLVFKDALQINVPLDTATTDRLFSINYDD